MTTTQLARAILIDLYQRVPDTYATLLIAVTSNLSEKTQALGNGTVQSTSANGHYVAFVSQSLTGASQEDIAAVALLLFETYEDASNALISSGVASPTDAQIYTEMRFRLRTPDAIQTDFTNLRQ